MEEPFLRGQQAALPVYSRLLQEFEKEKDFASAYVACNSMLQLLEKKEPAAIGTTLMRYHLAQLCEKTDRQLEADRLYEAVLTDMNDRLYTAEARNDNVETAQILDSMPPVSERTPGTMDNIRRLLHFCVGFIVFAKYQKAEPITVFALKLARLANNNEIAYSQLIGQRAELLCRTKRFQEIDALMKKKLELEMKIGLGKGRPLSETLSCWGHYSAAAKNYPQALHCYLQAVAIDEKVSRDLLAPHLRSLGAVLNEMGRTRQSQEAIQRADRVERELASVRK
jgi:tetratricopeptide (TPR) repeat protein